MKKRGKWMAVGVIFLSGVLAGFVGGLTLARLQVRRTVQQGPEAIRNVVVSRLERELKLTPEQQERILPIVDRTHRGLQRLKTNQRPYLESLMEQAFFELRMELTEPQKARLDQIHADLRTHWMP